MFISVIILLTAPLQEKLMATVLIIFVLYIALIISKKRNDPGFDMEKNMRNYQEEVCMNSSFFLEQNGMIMVAHHFNLG